jgi:hypothetical protein
MLERPTPPSRRRDRQRAWRRRVKIGVAVVPVEVDAAILELLTRLHWLEDRDAGGQAGSRGRDRAHAAGRGAALGLCVTVTQSPTEKLERKPSSFQRVSVLRTPLDRQGYQHCLHPFDR